MDEGDLQNAETSPQPSPWKGEGARQAPVPSGGRPRRQRMTSVVAFAAWNGGVYVIIEPMSTVNESPPSKSPRIFLVVTSLLALAAASSPYVVGYFSVKRGVYTWAGTSPSDFAVYLAWMRTASLGGFRDQHLFAGGHAGMLINPVYWLLGAVCGVTGLPGFAVYHIGRILFGAVLLYVLWRFVRFCTDDPLTRRLAFLFLCFSSGFGWFLAFLTRYWSIDRWQPEAFTLLCLYTYPHFCVALILQVCTLGLMMKSELTGQTKYAVAAGLCAGLLAVEHTYDVITVAAVWLVYVASPPAAAWRVGGRVGSLRNHLLAGLCALPGVVYIAQAWHADREFAARVNVATLSLPLPSVLIGYGGVLLLAITGAYFVMRRDPTLCDPRVTPPIGLLLVVWAVVNMAISYVPVAFQRKLLQGEHIPLCILAAVGAACLLRQRLPDRTWDGVRVPEMALALFLSVGSVLYLAKDTRVIMSGRQQKVYRSSLLPGEVAALNWVGKQGTVISQPIPWVKVGPGVGQLKISDTTLALYVPGLTGRAVYCGHWAETPDFDERIADVQKIASVSTSDVERRSLLRKTGITYLIFSQTHDPIGVNAYGVVLAHDHTFMKVYANADAEVYQVVGGS